MSKISEYYFKSAKMWKVILNMEKTNKPLNKSPYNYTYSDGNEVSKV